jgi:hypothetical protein
MLSRQAGLIAAPETLNPFNQAAARWDTKVPIKVTRCGCVGALESTFISANKNI